MASQIMDIFTNSYLKQLRRPELLNRGPDDAYGANMLPGSESMNPWAGRDQANAKIGGQGRVVMGPSGSGLSPQGKTTSPFAALLAPATSPASKWMATSGWDKLKGIFGGEGVSNAPGYKELMENFTGQAPSFNVPEGVSELGGYNRLAQEFSPGALTEVPGAASGAPMELGGLSEGVSELGGFDKLAQGFDPVSAGLSMVPMGLEALTGNKTVGDVGSAAINTGSAIAQGGMNPISDAMALASLFKIFKGFF